MKLKHIPASSRYFFGSIGHVIWQVRPNGRVYAIAIALKTMRLAKLSPDDILRNPYLMECTPEHVAETLGLPLWHDEPQSRKVTLTEVYVHGLREVVRYNIVSDRIFSPHPRFLFSRS